MKEEQTGRGLWGLDSDAHTHSLIGCYLVKVAGTSSLQELFVSTHGDAERIDHLVPMMLCCGDDVTVLSGELLDLSLKQTTDPVV